MTSAGQRGSLRETSVSPSLDGQMEERDTSDQDENVSVVIRCRPLLGDAERASCKDDKQLVRCDEENKCVQVDEREFYFDQVFGPKCDNEQVYMRSARKLIESAFNGYNCTIFLYGQTGTGKTHTHSSITLSSFAHLFSLISDSNQDARFLIRASYYELYNENFRDLLSDSKKALELRESKSRGVHVKDLTCFLVNNPNELEKLKRIGDKRRAIAATKMNEHSSRSHSIFSITIETIDSSSTINDTSISTPSKLVASSALPNSNRLARHKTTHNSSAIEKSGKNSRQRSARPSNERENASNKELRRRRSGSSSTVRLGRLHLIDLAGSERQSKSGSQGLQLKEASRINLSLTCLSLVIRALTDKSCQHVPYRSSKLTRLLSNSLGGNSKTLLVACISPAHLHLEETLNTLRFASRTKQIKNRARVNEDSKDALLRNYRQQIDELRKKLQEQMQLHSQIGSDTAIDLTNDETLMLAASVDSNVNNSGTGLDVKGEQQNQLVQQLKLLREKIMIGGENLLEKAEMHERLLEASRIELEEKRKEEARLRQELERKKTIIEHVVQSKDNLEQQRDNFNAKLKQVVRLYKQSKDELRDLGSEHEQLKENLLQSIRATSKEIKYADCIIEDFIPREYLDLINTHARYDDESDEWQIKYIALSGNNMAQTKRLIEGRITSAATTTSSELDEQSAMDSAGRNKATKSKEKRRPINSRPDPYIRILS